MKKNNAVAFVPIVEHFSKGCSFVSIILSDSLILFSFLPPHLLPAEPHMRGNLNILLWADINGEEDDNFFRNVVITEKWLTGSGCHPLHLSCVATVGTFPLLHFSLPSSYFNAIICSFV